MNKRYQSLDGLRALSALGIVLMHVCAEIEVSPSGCFLYDTIIPSFSKLIFIFFTVSAFALCCGYYEKFKKGQITPNEFYLRRYDRILPFFSIVVLIDIIINSILTTRFFKDWSGLHEIWISIIEGFTDITLSYGLLPNPSISVIGVGWFLGVIFLFYFIFPFFIFMIDNKKRAWKSLFICYILTFICIGYFFTDKFINFKTSHQSIIYDSSFLIIGGLIYLYKDKIELLGNRKYAMLGIGFLAVLFYWLFPCNPYMEIIILNIICACLIVYAISSDSHLLNNKVMHFLSGISLQIYLTHMICFRAVELLQIGRLISNPVVTYWITVLLTIILSVCASLGIEAFLNLILSKHKAFRK